MAAPHFINRTSRSVGNANTRIGNYTSPASSNTMAISFTFANLTANVVTVSAFLNDATDGSNTFIVRGANVPAGGALTFDTVKVALETGDSVYVYSGANNALDVIMSAMELR